MKEKIQYIKEKRWIHYLFIILVGVLVSIPLLKLQIRETHDGFIHLIRLIGLDKSIENREFPFLVFPHICRDFGYSMTAFYPPIVTFIPYILGIISFSFVNGLKIFAMLTTILSGIFMYNFIEEATKNKGVSLISSILYMILPYRFEDIYTRFAIGEFTAFVFIPIVFQGLYNLLQGDKKRHFYIAIGAIGLLLSHTISTIFTALFCIIYILFNIKEFFEKEVVKKCIVNVIFVLLITTLFTIPMLEFKLSTNYSIFNPDVMRTGGNYVQSKTIEIWQLLKDKGEENGVSFVIGVPMIFMLAITPLVYKNIDKKHKDFYIISWIFGLISTFMCFKYFPWKSIPNIFNTIQYPWRMLGFSVFFLSPVCGINIYFLIKQVKKENLRNIVYLLFVIVVTIFTIMKLNTYKVENSILDKEYETDLRNNLIISHFSVNREYLPYKAIKLTKGYLNERENRIYVLEGEAKISDDKKEGLNYECKIISAEEQTILELPYLFYPGYIVTLKEEGKNIKLETFESEHGFLCVKIPENIENRELIVDYTGTTIEKVSYVVSGISLIGLIIYIIYFKKKNRTGETNEE